MKRRTVLIALAPAAAIAAVLVAAIPIAAQQSGPAGPVARYDMRAGTLSGMGAMGAMNPMAMMMGGGGRNQAQHELLLRLGTSRAPDKGNAKADHFMPSGMKLGKSVALVTPRQERGFDDELPQKPKGRILIYWGCGERAPRGQPVVIDFARLAAGQVPPGLWTTSIIRDWGPTLSNSRTFGRWPAEDGKYARGESSLPGAHRVAGNYTPEIAFTLSKDFMAPLAVRTTANPSGSTLLSWRAIPDATGYLAFMFGGKQIPGSGDMGDMVMWTSSASRQFGGGLSDWLTPAQVSGLVRDRTVLAPTTTTCTIPAEVKRDAPDFRFGTLTAYGPMEEFAYPPRPADARTPWRPEWTARIRHRSTTSWMEAQGMSMGGMEQGQQQGQPECKPRRGMGGLLGGALGLPGGGC